MELPPGGLNPVLVAAVNHINDRLRDQAEIINTFPLLAPSARQMQPLKQGNDYSQGLPWFPTTISP